MTDSNSAKTVKLGTTELLFRAAQKMDLRPEWVSPGDMFAVTIDGKEQYISLAKSPLNSHASAGLAKDKYLTRCILERNNIANIPFSRPQSPETAEQFLAEHKKIVAKPVFGSGSRDIHIITSASQIRALDIKNYILEKYITGQELRYLVLNGHVVGVHLSKYGTSVSESRALERISYPENVWDETLINLSLRVADILGLGFATVDYLVEESGQANILEVNTTPGLKWFHAPSSGPTVDVAAKFLKTLYQPSKEAALCTP